MNHNLTDPSLAQKMFIQNVGEQIKQAALANALLQAKLSIAEARIAEFEAQASAQKAEPKLSLVPDAAA